MDTGLVYIFAVVLVVAIGFVFAMRMAIAASLSADREWAATSHDAAAEAPSVPAATAAAAS